MGSVLKLGSESPTITVQRSGTESSPDWNRFSELICILSVSSALIQYNIDETNKIQTIKQAPK